MAVRKLCKCSWFFKVIQDSDDTIVSMLVTMKCQRNAKAGENIIIDLWLYCRERNQIDKRKNPAGSKTQPLQTKDKYVINWMSAVLLISNDYCQSSVVSPELCLVTACSCKIWKDTVVWYWQLNWMMKLGHMCPAMASILISD